MSHQLSIPTLDPHGDVRHGDVPHSDGVFSDVREVQAPNVSLPHHLRLNVRQKMDGLNMLGSLDNESVAVVFFDPQFRGVYDKLQYGNEHTSRNFVRVGLPQMSETMIMTFIKEIDRVLMPSGHLFLWIDKFHLCQDFQCWLEKTTLHVVDMVIWDKEKIGLGYRTRHRSEFCVVIQKEPKRAKGHWKSRNIPDVWQEKIVKTHTHAKPVELQKSLIEAVSNVGDIVVDPAAGGYSVLKACKAIERDFLGCDIKG